MVAGCLVGIASWRWPRLVGTLGRGAAFVATSIPVIVILFWAHYPLQMLLDAVVDPFFTTAGTLSLLNVVLCGDIIRQALEDFPTQYIQAGRACGMSSKAIVAEIQLPIVFRHVIPPILSTQVTMLQWTLFASFISVDEVFRVAQQVNAQLYRPVEVYSALAVVMLLVCAPLHVLSNVLRRRYTRDYSEK